MRWSELAQQNLHSVKERRFSGPFLTQGFTLLEVMIAVAIIAIALTSLLGSQSHSLSLAIETRFNSTASFLIQEKLAEFEAGVVDFVNDDGEFGDEFPGYSWSAEVEELYIAELDEYLEELDPPLYRVNLIINWGEGGYSASATYIGREKI